LKPQPPFLPPPVNWVHDQFEKICHNDYQKNLHRYDKGKPEGVNEYYVNQMALARECRNPCPSSEQKHDQKENWKKIDIGDNADNSKSNLSSLPGGGQHECRDNFSPQIPKA